jgi:Domain of unknown function (DUF4349)
MSRPENENPKDRLEETARELRKHRPHPSEALISRIERLAERGVARRSHSTRVQLSRRRLVFALAAALAIATVGAIVHGELQQSSKTAASGVSKTPYTPRIVTSNQNASRARKNLQLQELSPSSTQTTGGVAVGQYAEQHLAGSARSSSAKATPTSSDATATGTTSQTLASIPLTKRLADLRAVLTLKVEDRAQLSRATATAMKIASKFGGYIVTAHYDAPSRGVAVSKLKFKVPATHAQDALTAISALGEILSQKVSLEDVQRAVTVETDRIKVLEKRITDLEASLSYSSLTSAARTQLQVQLANARANLHSLQAQRTANVRRGRLATITLTLTTGDLPKLAAKPSRIHKAIDRAWNGLSSEISWAAIGLIVASPFLLLAAVLAVLVRSRRRREEHRLLEQ